MKVFSIHHEIGPKEDSKEDGEHHENYEIVTHGPSWQEAHEEAHPGKKPMKRSRPEVGCRITRLPLETQPNGEGPRAVTVSL